MWPSACRFSLVLNYFWNDHNAPKPAGCANTRQTSVFSDFEIASGGRHHLTQRGPVSAFGLVGTLQRGRRTRQSLVAIGKASELADHFAMRARMRHVVGTVLRHPLADQPHTAFLIAKILGMHQRQVEELSRRFVNLEIPAPVDRYLRRRKRRLVGGKGPC